MNFSIEFKEPVVSVSGTDASRILNGFKGNFNGWDGNGKSHFLYTPNLSVSHEDGEIHLYTEFNDTEWIINDVSIDDEHLALCSNKYFSDGIAVDPKHCNTVIRIPIMEDRICRHS